MYYFRIGLWCDAKAEVKLHFDSYYVLLDCHTLAVGTTRFLPSSWKAGVSEMKSAETSNCGRFWGPLVMVDVEPLSALNQGQTANTGKYIMMM